MRRSQQLVKKAFFEKEAFVSAAISAARVALPKILPRLSSFLKTVPSKLKASDIKGVVQRGAKGILDEGIKTDNGALRKNWGRTVNIGSNLLDASMVMEIPNTVNNWDEMNNWERAGGIAAGLFGAGRIGSRGRSFIRHGLNPAQRAAVQSRIGSSKTLQALERHTNPNTMPRWQKNTNRAISTAMWASLVPMITGSGSSTTNPEQVIASRPYATTMSFGNQPRAQIPTYGVPR